MSKTINQEEVLSLQNNYFRIFCLELNEPSRDNVKEAIKLLNDMDGILCAIPNFEIKIEEDEISSIVSNNTNYNEPSAIYNKIGLNTAWSNVTQQNTVRVAVIDTGIDEEHSAFGGIYNSIIDESSCAHIESTTYEIGTIPFDQHGHGTHVAGIIAGAYNSHLGFRGVCSNVELIAVRIFDESGRGDLCDLVKAMNHLNGLSNPVDIINISAGFLDRFYELDVQEELADAIFGGDSLVVCAAGNNNEELIAGNKFPGGLNPTNNQPDQLITVGASTFYDTRWVNNSTGQGSNYGEDTVDLFAPGELIVSCVPEGSVARCCLGDDCTRSGHVANGYHAISGTSMATPFVTGVAALMLSVNSNLTAEDIKSVITDEKYVDYSTSSRDPINELYMICESGGRLNAYKAVSAVLPTFCSHSSTYYIPLDVNGHWKECSSCLYIEYESHDNRCMTVSSSQHRYICNECGYSRYESHTPQYTVYSDNEHKVRCSSCGYTVYEDHDLYMYEDNGDDPCTVMCRDCNYTVDCAETADYENRGAEGHYITCHEGCFELFEPHVLKGTNDYDKNGHVLECRYCGYLESGEHELYLYAVYGGDNGCTVKCCDCDYSIDCGGSPEIDNMGESGHYVGCVCGSSCFSFVGRHQNRYLTQGVGSHLAICERCDYYAELSHEWFDNGSELECIDCGETISYSQLNSIGDLTDEELAVLVTLLPEDKLEALLASLPEDDLARVTALLPSDDEHLTE